MRALGVAALRVAISALGRASLPQARSDVARAVLVILRPVLAMSAAGCFPETGPVPYLRQLAGTVDGADIRYNRVARAELEAVWEGHEVVRLETDNGLMVFAVSRDAGDLRGQRTFQAALVRLPEATGSKWYCSTSGSFDLAASDVVVDLFSLSRIEACETAGPYEVRLGFADSTQATASVVSDFPPLVGAVLIDTPSRGAYTFEGPGVFTYLDSRGGLSKAYLASFGALALDGSGNKVALSCPASSMQSSNSAELTLKGLHAPVPCPGAPVTGHLRLRPPSVTDAN
jgi:hypothetical protein